MKNMMNAINSKMITAQIRANQALKNDDGMEVIQFLAVTLVSITIAGLLANFGKDAVSTAITNVSTQLSGLFTTGG